MISKAALLLLAIAIPVALAIAVPAPPTVGHEPNLCDIDGGKWCTSCGSAVGPACPAAGDSGWLCCDPTTNICVTTTANDCDGAKLGWCDFYTVDAAGAATCWD